jgi:hypothetical protein
MHVTVRYVASALVVSASLACARKAADVAADSTSAPHDMAGMTHPGATDTGFAAMQERGKMAMGVDQYTSTHTFDALPDGGRIELLRNVDDTLGIQQIRAHLKLIQHAFQAGDFSTPAFVHMQQMPGASVMAKKRDVIVYTYSDLPRGGAVRMTTSDPEALAAIHEFMGAQREEHHAMGKSGATP